MKCFPCIVSFALILCAWKVEGQQTNDNGRVQENIAITLACSKSEIVAGENVPLEITITNRAPYDIIISPLQPFLYLDLVVEQNGKRVPPQLKKAIQPWEDVSLASCIMAKRTEDLCTWFPLGLYQGEFDVYFTYVPLKRDRDVMLRSNAIHLKVLARTADQESAYLEYVAVLSSSGKDAIEKASIFLKQHKSSMFETRVCIELANRYVTQQEFDKVIKILNTGLAQGRFTNMETIRGRYLIARSLRGTGRLQEAIAEIERIQEPWAKKEAANWRQIDGLKD